MRELERIQALVAYAGTEQYLDDASGDSTYSSGGLSSSQ